MKKISIRHVLLLTVVGLTLGAVFVVSSVYSTTATTMFNQLGMSDMLQDMATVSDRLSTYVGRVRDVASAVAGDIEAEENFNAESFAQSVRFYTGNTEDISALILVDEYGTPIMGLPGAQFKETCNLPALDWYRQAMDAEIGETVLSRPHVQNLYPNSYPWVVSVLRKVRYNQDGEQNIGILMVDMRLEPLEEICRSVELGSSGCPYILSQDDEIIFHPDQKLLALELISEESIRTEEEDGRGREHHGALPGHRRHGLAAGGHRHGRGHREELLGVQLAHDGHRGVPGDPGHGRGGLALHADRPAADADADEHAAQSSATWTTTASACPRRGSPSTPRSPTPITSCCTRSAGS